MIKYKAEYLYHIRITKVEAEKETASTIWINGMKKWKHSAGESYFDSFDEAKKHIIKNYEYTIEITKRRLICEQDCLEKAKALKEPK